MLHFELFTVFGTKSVRIPPYKSNTPFGYFISFRLQNLTKCFTKMPRIFSPETLSTGGIETAAKWKIQIPKKYFSALLFFFQKKSARAKSKIQRKLFCWACKLYEQRRGGFLCQQFLINPNTCALVLG